ncbi:MAG: serine O-acetyltransferase [Pirellulaceae bacterium]
MFEWHIPLLPKLITYCLRFVFCCWLPHTAHVGCGCRFGYGGLGIVIHSAATIGNRVHIDQGVTIGGNGTEPGVPIIEDDVYIGAGAKVLGPIRIGRGAVVGANAVVIHDVSACTVVAGVPARVIREDIDPDTFLYHRASQLTARDSANEARPKDS